MRTLLPLAMLVALPFAALAEDLITGQWTYRMDTPMGESKAALTLKAEDGKLTGKFVFEGNRTLEITEGTVDGSSLKFTVKRDRQSGGAMTYRMIGKVDGKTIKGAATTAETPEAGEMTWSATRD
jgi:hypothetical protein